MELSGQNVEKAEVKPSESITSLHQITQDLAGLIKHFQKQLQDIPVKKQNSNMCEVPSSLIEPKTKEFFKPPEKTKTAQIGAPKATSNNNAKNVVPNSTKVNTNNKSTPQVANKTSNNNNSNKNNNGKNQMKQTVSNQSNMRSKTSYNLQTKTSNTSGGKKFSSTTCNALTAKTSANKFMARNTSSFSLDPLKALKEDVQRAIRDHKTFTVRGNFGAIRKALLSRGWVEKFHASYRDQVNEDLKKFQTYSITELLPLLKHQDLTVMCKNLIKSKLLGAFQVDFYWGMSDDMFKENPDKIKLTMMNKLKRDIFSYTSKQGLCDGSNNQTQWFQKPNVYQLNHPRSYGLGKNGDWKGFKTDFYQTAAMSLLKWIVKNNMTKEVRLVSPTGKIPLEAFHFAVNECCKLIKRHKHEDIDFEINDASEHEWDQFLEYFYKIVHYSNHFKSEGKEITEDSLIRKSNYILNELHQYWPFVEMDGMMNIWMLKPTVGSRGRGIHMCRTLNYVQKIVQQNANIRYIIQKYIERPLLIHNTKFDIRQWFLISNTSPLTIWMYRECYLRFSSQTYNLRKLHESIHLTNNAVQAKYKNNSIDAALPTYNMWDSKEFQNYLTNIGYPTVYQKIIYPGMKECITAAVLMHQEKMVVRRNCFELYGADFILTEDYKPWLLEINSNPALSASTPVTARMCPKVLEDVIKVVIDYARNCKSTTGEFEQIYKEKVLKLPPASNLEVQGLAIPENYFYDPPMKGDELSSSEPQKRTVLPDKPDDTLKQYSEDIKKSLKNLLHIIHQERHKREVRHKQVGCDSFFSIDVKPLRPQCKEVSI